MTKNKNILFTVLILMLTVFPVFAQNSSIRRVPLVFTIRPEFQYIERAAQTLGGNVGLGLLSSGGFYFVAEARGGENYLGGDLNIGGLIRSSKNPNVKNVLGVSGGFEQMDIIVRLHDKRNVFLAEIIEETFSFGGVFHKLLLGSDRRGHHFDITNKVLFGYRNEHTDYRHDETTDRFFAETDMRFRAVYSLSVGYTFAGRIRRTRTPRQDLNEIILPVRTEPQEELVYFLPEIFEEEEPEEVEEPAIIVQTAEATVIKTEVILFEFGTYRLTQSTERALFEILTTLIKNPETTLEISGHTDDTGKREGNILLSRNRALTIGLYFWNQGISRDRLRLSAHGPDRPAVENECEERRVQNRRVEIRVLLQN